MATLVQVVGVWAWVVTVVVAAPHHTPARQLRVSDGTERRGEGLHSLTGISSRGRRHAPLDKEDDDEWESSLAPPRKRSAEEQPVSDQPFKREALEVNIGTGILVKGAGTTQRPFNFPQSPTYSPTQPPDLSTQRPIIFPESGPQATPTPPINPTQVPPTIFHSPFFPNDLFPPPGSRPNPSDGSPPKPPSQNPPSQRPSRPSDFFPGQTTPNSHFVPIIPTRRPNIITNTPSLRPVFPNTPPQGSVFPNTPAQGSFFPNTPPQGSVFPNTPPQGSVFPNTPQGSVFPNTPPQESVFPNTPPQGSIFPNTPPQGSVFPNTPPQGSFFPNTPPQGSVFPNTPSQGPGRFPNTPQRPVGFPIPPNQGPDYIHPTTRRPKFPGFPIPPSPTTRRPCSCRNHTTNINPATPTIPPTTFFSPSPVAPFFPTVAPLFPTVAPQFPTPTPASARPVTPNPGGFRPSFRPTFTPVAGFPVFPNSQSRPVHPNSQHRPVLFIPTNIRSPDVLRVNQRPVSTNGLPRFPAVNGQSFITPHFRLFIPHLSSQGVNQVKNNSDK